MSRLNFEGISEVTIYPQDSLTVAVEPLNCVDEAHVDYLRVHLSTLNILSNDVLVISPSDWGSTVYRDKSSGNLFIMRGEWTQASITLLSEGPEDQCNELALERLCYLRGLPF